MSGESSRILNAVIAGDDRAAQQLFDKYVHRLIALARSHLSTAFQARIDAEDIVQSVFRSFFRKVRGEEAPLPRSGGLWRLLAGITVNKSRKRVEFERAQKRDPRREIGGASFEFVLPEEPGPEDAVVLIDEVSAFMQKLNARDRQILEMRLQGNRLDAIAPEIGISEATVRRALERIGQELERRLLEE